MNELSAALRQLADRIEAGQSLPGANQCALVLANEAGTAQATYIGHLRPPGHACIKVLAAGIMQLDLGQAPSHVFGGATRSSS